METRAEESQDKNLNNLAVRSYLDQTVVPLLLKGLTEVSKIR